MAYAIKQNGVWVEITAPFTVERAYSRTEPVDPANPNGPQHVVWYPAKFPASWPENVSRAEMELHGVQEIGEGEIPEGHQVVSALLVDADGSPMRAYVTEPAPPPAPPASIDMRQARLKLDSEPHEDGTRLDAVEAFVATQSRAVQIEWEYARELRRDHPLVAIMGLFFGLDGEALDQWFREAAAIGPTVTA